MSGTLWRRLRQLVQLVALVLFGYFLARARGGNGFGLPLNILSRLNPLLGVSATLASRSLILTFLPIILTVAVTLVVGRVWCGWICPAGTILDLYGPRGRRGVPLKLRQAKYYILFTILVLAVLGSLAFMYLDPITAIIRGIAGVIYPALARVPVIGPALKGLYRIPPITGTAPAAKAAAISWAIAAVFVLMLVLNLIERRFWCRYLCPLGATIGLLSRWAWLKRAVRKEGMQPCRLDCPAGTNVTGFLALASRGRYGQASDLIRQTNPLTTVCGHVCPHPCETGCNRAECDQAVSINAVERFVGDWVRQHGGSKLRPVPVTKEKKVAIIGAGPAGLTAAFHLRRAGYAVQVFEKLPVAGGMLAAGIPRYRLPREVLEGDINEIRRQGVEIQTGVAVDGARLAELRKTYDAVLIAVGAHRSRKLDVPGEDLAGVVHGVDFLRDVNLTGKATIGSRVAVIGGGDVAIDAARCALRLGSEVTIFYRRSRQEMPARAEEIEEAEEEGVKIQYLATPTRIIGENGRVVGMECIRLELGEPDSSGRRRPVPVPGSEFTVPVDTVIPAIGQYTDTTWLEGSGIEVLSNGTIKTDAAGMTTVPGIFAAGDAASGPATVTEAVGAARKVAAAIERYLRGEATVAQEPEKRRIPFSELPAARRPAKKERTAPALLAAAERVKGFAEVRQTLTPQQAVSEARRCINWNCGECTLCAQICPMGAIDPRDFSSHPSECTVCMDCVAFCPGGASEFRGGWAPSPVAEFDPSRRQLLISAAAGVVGFGLTRVSAGQRDDPFLLRPPGAQGLDFYAKCVRCGQCIQACPDSALQMTLFEAGWDAAFTPRLVPRKGYCSYNCNACGQICPSQAIPPLSLEAKRRAVIGNAWVNRDTCIRCMLCVTACPTTAIEKVMVGDTEYPQVASDRCIGCGTCEFTCPVPGEAAIRVYALGHVPPTPPAEPAPTPTPAPTAAPGETAPAPEATPTAAGPVPSDQRAWVDRKQCIRCMICVKTCPQDAIVEVEDAEETKWPQVDIARCIGCGECVKACPRNPKAIQLYDPDKIPS